MPLLPAATGSCSGSTGASSYEPVDTDADGYQYSARLGCSYRLDRARNSKGRLTFDLRTKETSIQQ